jgi:hypothetical protein
VANTPKPMIHAFPSRRAQKRFLRKSWRRRRYANRRTIRRSRRLVPVNHSLRSMRELVAPILAGHYAVALLLLYQYNEAGVTDETLVGILRDLLPGRFKITYRTDARRPNPYQRPMTSTINWVYLMHESDLCVVLLAFKTRIWRVMKLVATKSPALHLAAVAAATSLAHAPDGTPDPAETALPAGVAG